MQFVTRLFFSLFILISVSACVPYAEVSHSSVAPITPMSRQIVLQRVSAVIVTDRQNLSGWYNKNFNSSNAPGDADGGSAAPITADGYFLTADHVLSRIAGRNVFVLYGKGGSLTPFKARVVWRDAASDLALLHIDEKTPFFYQWSPPTQHAGAGTPIIHGGISTGFRTDEGKLETAVPSESRFSGSRRFKMNLPLQPGDSGGPVVDGYGRLIGINSAVEFLVPMETAFFIDSEGNRPNVSKLGSVIQRDRLEKSR
ncbi:MAG: serine protease [Verrucomicrobia bacterium]|nr:MAG: serine protease [Verrucomicrobiota bacterium]